MKFGKRERNHEIKVTQKITYLEAKKIQENQPEITFAKVVQSLNTKPETKETSTQFNEKDSVIKANSKVITPTLKPKPKPTSTHQSRPPTKSQNSSQTQPTKTSGSQQRSRSRTADQKGKNGKEKDKDKEPNPYSKGASAIRSSWSIGSIPLRTWSRDCLLHVIAVSEKTKGLSSSFSNHLSIYHG